MKRKTKKKVPALNSNKNAQKWNYEKANLLFEELLKWFEEEKKNVFISVFLASKRLHKSTLDYLIEKYDQRNNLAELKEVAFGIQESRLLDYGFKKMGDSKFAEFLLKNNHGYTEKIVHDTKHSGEIKTSEDVSDGALKALGEALASSKADDSE